MHCHTDKDGKVLLISGSDGYTQCDFSPPILEIEPRTSPIPGALLPSYKLRISQVIQVVLELT